MDISEKQMDKSAVTDGVWVEFDDETQFKIRSTESKQYVRAIQSLTRKLNGAGKRNMEKLKEVTQEAMATAIIVDWKGVLNKGKDLPCTDENARKLLAIPEVRDFIATEAQDYANFERERVAETADAVKKR